MWQKGQNNLVLFPDTGVATRETCNLTQDSLVVHFDHFGESGFLQAILD
jgi:hypothetical protein